LGAWVKRYREAAIPSCGFFVVPSFRSVSITFESIAVIEAAEENPKLAWP
jgi:hypothetical protein